PGTAGTMFPPVPTLRAARQRLPRMAVRSLRWLRRPRIPPVPALRAPRWRFPRMAVRDFRRLRHPRIRYRAVPSHATLCVYLTLSPTRSSFRFTGAIQPSPLEEDIDEQRSAERPVDDGCRGFFSQRGRLGPVLDGRRSDLRGH